ncbi:MAG: hypothetical protein BMS9Abin36_0142 [Gammaproteobacteria bacterium]|nr:MAG: hypothetical protein BMS9Abin36_0142 [Gammaproteobacteria bacterium]
MRILFFMRRLGLLLLILSAVQPVLADHLLMVRIEKEFPETMNLLQDSIIDHGYTVSRVQRVDIGLSKTGHRTAEYRLVFFGKAGEITRLSRSTPELIPFLPLKIVIFAEGEETLLLANDPLTLKTSYPDTSLHQYFKAWRDDIHSIMESVYQQALD